MARKLDYRWHLRQVMAERGMFATTDLIDPLAARGIRLSSSQVYRLVVERPERLSLKILMALLDILDCTMSELIEPAAAAGQARAAKAVGGTESGVGELRPKRARITKGGNYSRCPPTHHRCSPDPIGVIVDVVARTGSAMNRTAIEDTVTSVAGGRAKRRGSLKPCWTDPRC